MEKFDFVQFTFYTEITVYLHDREKLETALEENDIIYTFKVIGNDFFVKTQDKIGETEYKFLKGRIIPPKPKYKPKSKVKPIYDYNIVVGIDYQLNFIYKKLN